MVKPELYSTTRRNWLLIIIGIVVIIGTFWSRQYNPPNWAFNFPEGRLMYGYDGSGGGWAYYILGIVLIIIGYIMKTTCIKFNIAGQTRQQVLFGKKSTIETLFRLLNERRFNAININSDIKTP